MLATCQLYPTQSLQHTAYIQDHDHEGGGAVAGLSIYTYIYIYHLLLNYYYMIYIYIWWNPLDEPGQPPARNLRNAPLRSFSKHPHKLPGHHLQRCALLEQMQCLCWALREENAHDANARLSSWNRVVEWQHNFNCIIHCIIILPRCTISIYIYYIDIYRLKFVIALVL